jgi:heterodisulfide reductase subunit A
VRVREPILGQEMLIGADLVALSPAIVAGEDNRVLAEMLGVPLNGDGFFQEAQSKLRPVDFAPEGIFLCGLAHSPRTMGESIVQAKAAAGRAAVTLTRGRIEGGGSMARVRTRNCAGCRLCIEVCPFGAIDFDEEEKTAVVSEAACQGCGLCSAVCPAGVSQQDTFTKRQMLSMIDAGLERSA